MPASTGSRPARRCSSRTGRTAVEALHARFPNHPIVADVKIMDGGYLEAEMMAKAGASFVVVMGRAHEATIRCVRRRRPRLRHPGDGRQHARRRSRRERPLDGVARRRRHHPPHRLRRARHGQGAEPDGRARRGGRRRRRAGAGRRRPDDRSRRSSARRTAPRSSSSARRSSSTPTTSSRPARISAASCSEICREIRKTPMAARSAR